MIQVETITPHQYRQLERVIGEIYYMDEVHVELLTKLNWIRPIILKSTPAAEPMKQIIVKGKYRSRDLRITK